MAEEKYDNHHNPEINQKHSLSFSSQLTRKTPLQNSQGGWIEFQHHFQTSLSAPLMISEMAWKRKHWKKQELQKPAES